MDGHDAVLEKCLRAAVRDEELVVDLLAACKLSGCNAATLALWSPQDVEERLFLTPDEALKLIENATAATSGRAEQPVPALSSVAAQEAPVSGAAGAAPRVTRSQDGKPAARAPPPPAAAPVPEPAHAEPVPALVRSVSPKHVRPSSAPLSHKSPEGGVGRAIPSYLRPTTAHTLRSSKQLEPEKPKLLTASVSLKPGLVSRLLAPTAAFLSRVARTKAETKEARAAEEASQVLRRSQVLSVVLNNPQGQRITRSQPFSMATDTRPKTAAIMSTDEAAMLEAQKHAFKRHEVPASLKVAKPLDGFARTHSTPVSPDKVFKPFQLSSMEKHTKYQEMRTARLAVEKQAAEAARHFKAREVTKDLFNAPQAPAKRAVIPVTTPVVMTLHSAERADHHAKVLEPLRRARLSQAEREALEERERRAAAEEAEAEARAVLAAAEAEREAELASMDVSTYRKSLVFKARDMPSFSTPFKPDHTKAAPVTRAEDFKLHTTQRLGALPSVRERCDTAAPGLTASVCLAGSLGGVYASSLRSYGGPARGAASMRASVGSFSARQGRAGSAATNMRASTSQLPSYTRTGSARVGRVRPQVVPELKEALEVALEVATGKEAARRTTDEFSHMRASNPQLITAV